MSTRRQRRQSKGIASEHRNSHLLSSGLGYPNFHGIATVRVWGDYGVATVSKKCPSRLFFGEKTHILTLCVNLKSLP